jgi:hypothetical protein
MTNVEFRLAPKEDTGHDTFLSEVDMSSVPDVGELINIKGEPYRVINRAWSISRAPAVYCYVRVR